MEKAILVIVLGLIGIGGFRWQSHVIDNEFSDFPNRNIIPAILSIIIIIGILIQGVIAIFLDSGSGYTWGQFGGDILKVLVLSISFNFKAYFGPMYIAFTLCTATYFFLHYGEIQTWSFINSFLHWIFDSLPPWYKSLYVIGSFVIVLFGCFVDSFEIDIF